jgi:hypothetical protein
MGGVAQSQLRAQCASVTFDDVFMVAHTLGTGYLLTPCHTLTAPEAAQKVGGGGQRAGRVPGTVTQKVHYVLYC